MSPSRARSPWSGSSAPLVVLLHCFPQFWWAWRHQLEALGEAGYRVAAMDLRGTGASDKPPIGYDAPTRTRTSRASSGRSVRIAPSSSGTGPAAGSPGRWPRSSPP